MIEIEKIFVLIGEDGNDIMDTKTLTLQPFFVQDKEMEIFIPIGEPFEIKLK